MKSIDTAKINSQIKEGLKEAQQHINSKEFKESLKKAQEIDMEKMKKELEKSKIEVEKSREQIKKELQKMKDENNAVINLIPYDLGTEGPIII